MPLPVIPPAFDSGAFTDSANSSIAASSDSALGELGGTVRAIGQQPAYVASDAVKTAANLPSVPLINNASLKDITSAFSPPPDDGMTSALKGISASSISGLAGQYVGQYVGTLEQMVAQKAIDCINQSLASLIRSNPIADALFNYDLYKSQLLGGVNRYLSDKFNRAVNDLLYNKLQVQKVAMFNQQILDAVNSICSSASPCTVKEYSTNPASIQIAASKAASSASSKVAKSATAPSPSSKSWSSLT